MTIGTLLTIAGLLLDLFGVILIFIYGITVHLKTDGQQFLIAGESEAKKKQEQFLEFRSKIGLTLIGIGFLLQMIGQLIN